MSDDFTNRVQSAIRAQRERCKTGDSWDNYAIARATLHSDLGRNGAQREPYHLDEATRDILIAHARQDAAHALCNTNSLLKRVDRMTRLVYLVVPAVFLLGIATAFGLQRMTAYF